MGLDNVRLCTRYFIIDFNFIADIACEEAVVTEILEEAVVTENLEEAVVTENLDKVHTSIYLLATFRVLFNISFRYYNED